MQDVLGGQVQLAIGSEFLVKPHIDSGGVIPLQLLPQKIFWSYQIPTIAESGFPGFNAPAWWAVSPWKTPPAIVNAMNQAVTKA